SRCVPVPFVGCSSVFRLPATWHPYVMGVNRSVRQRRWFAAAAATALAWAGTGCAPGTDRIEGAGATFPTPLYQDWIHSYATDVDSSLTIDYQSIGSGGGITQFLEQAVDWGTSERYLRDSDLADAEPARGCPAIRSEAWRDGRYRRIGRQT